MWTARAGLLPSWSILSPEDEANAFIEMVRKRHYDARHNVPAWILVDGRERQSDDGEPSRTSGMPTLEVLRGAELKMFAA